MNKRNWDIKNNETRIIVTHHCNYNCIFCHNEGITSETESVMKPTEKGIIKILDKVLARGCTDITFTGGEPLLFKDNLTEPIEYIFEQSDEAELTIVTNASLLGEAWLNKIKKYKKRISFNVSLHTSNEIKYEEVTGQKKFSLSEIKEKLLLLKKINFPFKINCVALKETMDSKQIRGLAEFSSEAGAEALKIIELLILEKQIDLFDSFIANSSIAKMLPENFDFKLKNERRKEYYSKMRDLTLELQKCRCQFGCNQCLTYNTTNIDAKGDFYPCFAYGHTSFNIDEEPFDKVLSRGMKVIEKIAQKFGDNSPSLIKDADYVPSREELYFQVLKPEELNKLLKKAELIQKREYDDYYFAVTSSESKKTIQLRAHKGDEQNSVLVISFSEFIKDSDLPYTLREFQHPQKAAIKDDKKFILSTMKTLGWKAEVKLHFEEARYRLQSMVIQELDIDHQKKLLSVFQKPGHDYGLIEQLQEDEVIKNINKNIDNYLLSM